MSVKERLHYIDIARGFLIIMVTFGHILDALSASDIIVPQAKHFFKSYHIPSFYMAGFFIITGLVTNFSRDSFFSFIWKKFKGIMLPVFVFVMFQHWLPFVFCGTIPPHYGIPVEIFYGEMPWFVSALFFSLMINFVLINRIRKPQYVLALSFVIYLIGVVLHITGIVEDRNGVIYCVNHIFTMNIFLTIGHYLRDINIKSWYLLIFGFVFECVVLSTNFIPFGLPYVTGGRIYLDFISMIPFLILGVCGTLNLLLMCKIIRECPLLEIIGKHTLGIYLTQVGVITPLVKILFRSHTLYSDNEKFLLFIIALVIVVYVGFLVSYVLNSKYLKWSVGKF